MASERFIINIIKPGLLQRDRFGNILDARSTVTLIQGDGLNIIVDTGLSSEKNTIIRSLRDLKLEPTDINYVINTHLHTDHTGNNDLFTNAEIIVHTKEVSTPKRDGKYRIITSELELFSALHLMETFGHTSGSISILLFGSLSDTSGRFALTGDALPIMDNYKKWVPPGINILPELALESMKKIVEKSDFIIPGHDKPFKIVDRSKRTCKYLS